MSHAAGKLVVCSNKTRPCISWRKGDCRLVRDNYYASAGRKEGEKRTLMLPRNSTSYNLKITKQKGPCETGQINILVNPNTKVTQE